MLLVHHFLGLIIKTNSISNLLLTYAILLFLQNYKLDQSKDMSIDELSDALVCAIQLRGL